MEPRGGAGRGGREDQRERSSNSNLYYLLRRNSDDCIRGLEADQSGLVVYQWTLGNHKVADRKDDVRPSNGELEEKWGNY